MDRMDKIAKEEASLLARCADLEKALGDALECMTRLPDAEGAYRVTCIQQARAALRGGKGEGL